MPDRPTLPIVIDSTMLTTFRACPQRFYDEFVLCLAPGGKSVDLHAGACVARALEIIYERYYLHKDPFDRALALAEIEFHMRWGDFDVPEKSSKTKERTWEAVVDYFREYPIDKDIVKPLLNDDRPTCEFRFALPLDLASTGVDNWPMHPSGEPFIFAGRFDTFGRLHSPNVPEGKLVVRDEKTMGSMREKWAESFAMRGQFIGYVWSALRLGWDVNTVVVRGLVILKTKFHQPQVIRQYDPIVLVRWQEQTRRDLARMVKCWEEDYWDYNFGETCTSYGLCPFMDLCTSEEPSRWYDTFRRRTWNPLEKDPEQEPVEAKS